MENIIYKLNAITNIIKTNPNIIRSLYILNLTNKNFKIIHKVIKYNIKVYYLPKITSENKNYISQAYSIIAKIDTHNFTRNINIIKKYKKLLILYNIQDPHNLSSCIRSAEAFGIELIIITQANTSKINTLINNISNGTSLLLKILLVKNINNIINMLQDNNFKLIALSIKGDEKPIKNLKKFAVLMGSEKNGIKKTIIKQCHYTYKIKTYGLFNSINVAVATAIILNKLT